LAVQGGGIQHGIVHSAPLQVGKQVLARGPRGDGEFQPCALFGILPVHGVIEVAFGTLGVGLVFFGIENASLGILVLDQYFDAYGGFVIHLVDLQELLPVTCDDVFAAFQVVLGDVIVQREDALAAIIDQQDGGGNPIDLKRPAFLRKFQHGIIGVNTL